MTIHPSLNALIALLSPVTLELSNYFTRGRLNEISREYSRPLAVVKPKVMPLYEEIVVFIRSKEFRVKSCDSISRDHQYTDHLKYMTDPK